jgi:hypothetical protein
MHGQQHQAGDEILQLHTLPLLTLEPLHNPFFTPAPPFPPRADLSSPLSLRSHSWQFTLLAPPATSTPSSPDHRRGATLFLT